MKDSKQLLELRKRRRKPKFIRQDSHKKKKLSKKWRKPRGLHSKMKKRRKGYRKIISSGYRSPKLVRGLLASGLKEIKINNIKDLDKLNNKTEIGIVISSTLGIKKKVEILKKCQELKLNVLNVKDIDTFIKKVEEKTKKKRKEKEEKKKEKSKKKKEREKLAKEREEKEKQDETKKTGEEDLADKVEKEDEKKKKEKQEKDKVLIKRK